MRIVFAFLLLVALPAIAHAQTPRVERIEIVETGIYQSEVTKTTAAPGSATGVVGTATDIKLVQATTTIPARLGVQFGFRYEIVGSPKDAPVKLRLVVLIPSPGIKNRKTGKLVARDVSQWDRKLGGRNFNSYTFDEAWEIVPGIWTFEIWQGNRKLATQSFTVVKQ